jgi:cytochrome c biogenesis protein CcdA
MGLAFAFGWTPCIGPVLATVLTLAANEASLGAGVRLLLVYSLGLGIPFVLAAVAIGPFIAFLQRFRRHLGRVETAMGLLLVLTGTLVLAGPLRIWLGAHGPALLQISVPLKLLLAAAGLALLMNVLGWVGSGIKRPLPAPVKATASWLGLLLLVFGVSLLGGSLNDLGGWLLDNVPVLSRIEELFTPTQLQTEIMKEGARQ